MGNIENMDNQGSQIPQLVKDAMEIIQTKYTYLYGVESVSDQLQVTKHHLIREFTKYVGISPGNYLKEVRMKKAASLLTGGDYSIDIIASMVGYEGANYFCKVFKSYYSISPGKYRAQNQPSCAETEQTDIYYM
jgi:AraC-like DNA-binding protein